MANTPLCIISLWVVEGLAAGLGLTNRLAWSFWYFLHLPVAVLNRFFFPPLLISGLGVNQSKDQPNLIVIK